MDSNSHVQRREAENASQHGPAHPTWTCTGPPHAGLSEARSPLAARWPQEDPPYPSAWGCGTAGPSLHTGSPLPSALLRVAAIPGPRQAKLHLAPCAFGCSRGSGGAQGTEKMPRPPRWRGHGDLGRPLHRRLGRAPRALQPQDAPTSPAGVDTSLPAAGPAAPSNRLRPQAPSLHCPGTRLPAAACGREA